MATNLSNDDLLSRLNLEISAAKTQHRVNPDVMFLVEARDEINRLNVQLATAASEIERLFRWINETRGEKIEVLRKSA